MSHATERRGRRLRATIVLSALLATAGLVWGISAAIAASSSPTPALLGASGSPTPAASATPLTLRLGTTFDADNLNPFIGYSGTSYEIFHLNYDFLVGYAPDLSPRPELATSWTTSPDGKTWTFQLRQGVKWQDGQPFTSADVAFTYNLIIKNNLTAFTSYTNNIVKVVPQGDFAVQMICAKPKANMLRLWIPILPQHIWAKVPVASLTTSYINKPPIIGTGPFQTTEVKKGEYVTLVKNPDYWVKGKPTIDELVMQIYQNADTMTQDLKTGALDYAMGIPTAQFAALKSQPGITANAADIKYFDEVCMNCYDNPDSLGNPVLRDPKFRQAISWAVDKKKIVDFAYGGYAKVGQGIITPDVPTYYWTPPADITFGFDLAKAGQMLDAAGYPLKDGVRVDKQGKPIVLRLWARSDDVPSQNSGKLITGWFRSLGLKITYQVLDSGTLSDALYNMKGKTYAPDFDMYIWGWGEYVDPDYILNVFTTGQIDGWNDSVWSNAEYDKLYTRQAQTLDPAVRKPIVDKMVQIYYQAAPYIVTNYEQQLEAYNTTKWVGWTHVPPPAGPVAFENDCIDTYLNLKPKAAAAATSSGGSSSTLIYVIVAVAAVAVVVVALLLLRRGRGKAVEE
ncbi:MAG TPA: ABC transporter substrate-binding protein [Thermoleophilia bacterium]|nr:ABC transporter substrate-binding protein [Thermoleophilia bacterium]